MMGRPRKDTGQGLPERVYLKSGRFYYVHAQGNRWENIGCDLTIAKQKAAELSQGAPVTGTLAYWLQEWKKEISARVKACTLEDRTRKDYEDAIEKLTVYFGKMDPSAVQSKHIGDYLDMGRELERSVRANREKAALSSCYTWLIRTGVVHENPCKGVRRNKEVPRDRWVSDDEYHAIYDLAGPAVRCWMILIYRTLQRPSDILKWSQKDIVTRDGQRLLEFIQHKTKKKMSIIVSKDIDDALNTLQSARKKKSSPLVPTEAGGHYTETGLASMFRRHVVKAGVADLAPYDMKSKGATDMYKDGATLEVICDLCGHESVTTTEIYIKTHKRESVEANSRVIKRS